MAKRFSTSGVPFNEQSMDLSGNRSHYNNSKGEAKECDDDARSNNYCGSKGGSKTVMSTLSSIGGRGKGFSSGSSTSGGGKGNRVYSSHL
jgi:hypothetical protein